MTIFFMILKILGIVLLSIIGIIVFLLLCILFVPVRYDTKGQFSNSFSIYAKATWLLHIFSIRYSCVEGDSNIIFRIFGIPIYDRKRKRKKQNVEKQKKKKHKHREKRIRTKKDEAALEQQNQQNDDFGADSINNSTVNTDINREQQISEEIQVSQADAASAQHTVKGKQQEAASEGEDYVNNENNEEKSGFFFKIKLFWEYVIKKIKMLWKAIRNIEYTFRRIYDRIISAVQKIQFYKAAWEKPETKRAFQTCKPHLFRILKNIRPRKVRINISFGMDDPAAMADILSVYCILFPWIGNSVIISPDFNEEKINGDFYIRGYVTIYILAWAIWAYLYDQDIRKLKECLNKEEF